MLLYKEPINCPLYQKNQGGMCPNEYPCSDVVITDDRMPSMFGIELLQKRAQNGCKLTSMNKALITAHLSEKEQKALQKLGSFYLAKPFHIADLSQWLGECERRLDIETPLGIRRSEKRTRVHLDVTYCVGNSDQTMTGIIANLSPSGFCLQANHDFEKAREIKVVSVAIPKHKVAFKIQDEPQKTKVTEIEGNVTRTGRVVPIVHIDTINKNGVEIQHPTGHNYQWIKERKIDKGAIISVVRSGDVIPYITAVIKPAKHFTFPDKCPSCETILTIEGVDLVCLNDKFTLRNLHY